MTAWHGSKRSLPIIKQTNLQLEIYKSLKYLAITLNTVS
jgi:hypothetical protein